MEKIPPEKIENFSALLNISNDPIIIINADGTILEINDNAAGYLNSKASELVGLSVYQVLPQEVAALRTRRIQTEGKLRFNGEIISNMEEGVLLVRASDDIIVYANPKMENMFGYQHNELEGKHISIVNMHTDISPEETALKIKKTLEKDGGWAGEIRNSRKDGTQFWSRAAVSYFDHHAFGPVWLAVHQDITEYKKAEENVRQSAAEHKRILDNIAGCVFYLKNRMVQWANRSAAELFGYSLDEITGGDMSIFYPDRESFEQLRREAYPLLAQGKRYSIEREMKTKGGELIWCSVIGQAIYHSDHEEGMIWLLDDITDRKRLEESIILANKTLEKRVAERTNALNLIIKQMKIEENNRTLIAGALEKSKQRYKRLLESVTGYVYRVTVIEGQPVATLHSPACMEVTGYTADEYAANPFLWHSMIYKEDVDKVMEQVNELFSGANAPTIEHRIIHKNGSILWIESTLVPTFDADGRLISYDGIINNINDRKVAEVAIQRANAYNRSLIEANPDPFVTIGTDGRITDVNSALEDMTGYLKDEIIGTDFSDYFTEPELASTAYQKAFSEGLNLDLPLELKHKDGRHTSVLYNSTVLRNESGQVIGVFAAARDITELRRLEREIAEISSRERRILGTRLHDDVGQTLTGISFLCKALEQTLYKKKSDDYGHIKKIKEGLNEVIKKVKDVSSDISAFKDFEGDIQSSLQGLAIRTEKIYNVKCSLDYDVGFHVRNGLVIEQFYYIASEAAVNAVKHGKAENIHIKLFSIDRKLNLAVGDDGLGFNPAKKNAQGMGIRIMKYRAGIIGATFDIKRTSDDKTVVLCSVSM